MLPDADILTNNPKNDQQVFSTDSFMNFISFSFCCFYSNITPLEDL